MLPPRAILVLAWLTVVLAASGCANMSAGLAPANSGAADEAAVGKWLTLHRQYRLATDADCHCADELASIRAPGPSAAPNYHPYLARGDFNHDGAPDAAYGLIRQGAPGAFSILVVDGAKAAKGRPAGALLDGSFKLGAEALFFGPPANPEGGLMMGPFESEACLIVPRLLGGYRLDCFEG